jgi:hypothetical protein
MLEIIKLVPHVVSETASALVFSGLFPKHNVIQDYFHSSLTQTRVKSVNTLCSRGSLKTMSVQMAQTT